MKLEELKQELEDKLVIHYDELELCLRENSLYHGKFINILADHRVESKVLDIRLSKLKRIKWFYYSGRSDEAYEYVLDKSDIKLVMDTDEDILRVRSQMEINDIKIKMLEDACKAFVGRGFNLKSAVEMRKIELGLI